MGKFTTFILVMSGLVLLFHLFGLIPIGTTPSSQLLALMLDPENISFSTFFSNYIMLAITGALAIGGIIIGVVTKNYELIAMTALGTYMATVMWDFMAVFSVIASENLAIALIFFAPLMFLFSISLVDWWRGRDT